jgi:hypothetical protein
MGGSAILGTTLVDELVPDVIDGIRGDLHPELGVRQFRVYVVTRTYASGIIGEGTYTDVEIELDPQPLVLPYSDRLGAGFKMEPCGIDTADWVKLKEISMTYTEAELGSYAVEFPAGDEIFIKITDAYGQGIPTTYWRHHVRPFNDRIKDMGWQCTLKSTSTPEGL